MEATIARPPRRQKATKKSITKAASVQSRVSTTEAEDDCLAIDSEPSVVNTTHAEGDLGVQEPPIDTEATELDAPAVWAPSETSLKDSATALDNGEDHAVVNDVDACVNVTGNAAATAPPMSLFGDANEFVVPEEATQDSSMLQDATIEGVLTSCSSLYPMLESVECMEASLPGTVGMRLAPFSSADLSALYENPLLQTHGQLLDTFYDSWELQNKGGGSDLYVAIERYRDALSGIIASRAAVHSIDKSCDEAADSAWIMQRHEKVSDGVCRDNARVRHRIEYEFAVFRREGADELRRRLERLRKEVSERKVLCAFDAESAHAEADLIIDDFFFECSFADHLRNMPPGYVSLLEAPMRPQEYSRDVTRLRGYLDTLFHFERLPEPKPMALTHSVREWILKCATALISVACSDDHRFLLLHLLECPPGVGGWAAQLVQFSSGPWTNYTVDHFGAMLHILLRPVALGGGGERRSRASAQTSDSGAGRSAGGGDSVDESVRNGLARSASASLDDWVLVEETSRAPAGNSTGERRAPAHAPSEEDVCAILDQLPFGELLKFVLGIEHETGDGEGQHRTDGSAPAGLPTDTPRLPPAKLLVLIAFADYFCKELGSAFDRYPTGTHQTILRRIARLITQILCFVSARYADHRRLHLETGDNTSAGSSASAGTDTLLPGWDKSLAPTPQRLSVEFDALIERHARMFMRARGMSVWQFLADLPYDGVSDETLWRLFLLMFTGWCGIDFTIDRRFLQVETASEWMEGLTNDPSVRDRFHDALMTSVTSDVFFLLTTLGHICSALPSHSPAVPVIVAEIASVAYGALSPARELSMATARDVLCTIAMTHPHVISMLVVCVAEATTDSHRAAYVHLFDKHKGLPVERWRPSDDDLGHVKSLFAHPIESPGCKVARLILGRMDFGSIDTKTDGRTILPKAVHRRVALMIAERTANVPPPQRNIVGHVMSGRLLVEREFADFCWSVLMSLSLRTGATVTLAGDSALSPSHDSGRPPDVSDEECAFLARRSVSCPIAAFVALQICAFGQVYSVFRLSGIPMLRLLVDGDRVDAAFVILVDALPRMVLTNLLDLASDSGFVSLVSQLLHAEITLTGTPLRYIIRWIAPVASEQGEPTDLVYMFLAMVRAQIGGRLARAGEAYPSAVEWVEFWCRALTAASDWHTDTSYRRVLNALFRVAATVPPARTIIRRCLMAEHDRAFLSDADPSRNQGFVGALQSLFMGMPPPRSLATTPRPLLGKPITRVRDTYASCCDTARPWLVFECLVMETWRELDLRRQIGAASLRHPQASIDTVLKESGIKPPFPVEDFVIYRWADFAISLDHTSSVLVLVWQMFFAVYFAVAHSERSPGAPAFRERFLGPVFFGPHQLSFLDRIRNRLRDLANYYSGRAANPPSPGAVVSAVSGITDSAVSRARNGNGLLAAVSPPGADERPRSLSGSIQRDSQLGALFAAMRLWLSDSRLQAPGAHLEALGSVYELNRLVSVLAGDCLGHPEESLWWDLVDAEGVARSIRVSADMWMARRRGALVTPAGSKRPVTNATMLHSISLEVPKFGAPAFSLDTPSISIDDALLSGIRLPGYVIESLSEDLEVLRQAAEEHAGASARLCALDADYCDMICSLYRNVPEDLRLDIPCDQRRANRVCAGPARLVFRFQQRAMDQSVASAIAENRRLYKKAIQADPRVSAPVCAAILRMRRTVRALVLTGGAQGAALRQSIRGMAVYLFYYLLNAAEDSTFPPALVLFHTTIREVGARYVATDAGESGMLLKTLIGRPDRLPLAVDYFDPSLSPGLADLYGRVKTCLSRPSHGPHFVASLLHNFDMARWCDRNPPLGERREFLSTLVRELCKYGVTPAPDVEDVVACEAAMLRTVLARNFAELYLDALACFLSECVEGRLPASCWWDFLGLFLPFDCLPQQRPLPPSSPPAAHLPDTSPGKDTVAAAHRASVVLQRVDCLSLADVNDAVSLLADFFSTRRRTAGTLFAQWVPYVPMLRRLFGYLASRLVDTLSAAPRSDVTGACEAFEAVWTQVRSLYSPWLSSESRNQPAWTLDVTASNPSALHEMVSSFAAIIPLMHRAAPSANLASDALLDYYVVALAPNAPDYVLAVIHDTLLECVPWGAFFASPKMVRQLLRAADGAACVSLVFLSSFIPLLDWERSLSIPLESPFYRELLRLLLVLASEPRVVCRDQYIAFLERAHSFVWATLTPDDYQAVLASGVVRGKGVAAFQERSPLSSGLRLLRAAADISSHGRWVSAEHFRASVAKLRCFVRYAVEMITPATNLSGLQYTAAMREMLGYAGGIVVAPSLVAGLSPDAGAEAVRPVLQDIFQLFNRCEGGELAVGTFCTATIDYVALSAPGELMCPLLVSAGAIASVKRMSVVFEACISRFFECEMDAAALAAYGATSGQAGWEPIMRSLAAPELTYDEFLSQSVLQGCALTLHAHALQLLAACDAKEGASCAAGLWNVEIDISRWIVKMRPTEGPRDCAYVLLVCRYILLLVRLSALVDSGRDHARDAQRRMMELCQALARLGEDKDSGGVLGAIGLGAKSPYSLPFRLACRALAAFIASRTGGMDGGGGDTPAQLRARLREVEQFVQGLTSLSKKSAYSERFAAEIAALTDIVVRSGGGLLDGPLFVAELVRRLFPRQRFMQCLVTVY